VDFASALKVTPLRNFRNGEVYALHLICVSLLYFDQRTLFFESRAGIFGWRRQLSRKRCISLSSTPERHKGWVTFEYLLPSQIFLVDDFSYLTLYYQAQYIVPDLLITVNFTALNISATTIVDTPKNSVQLMVGLTNDTKKVFQTTIPTSLIPGVNLFGMVTFKIRQVISSSVLAAVGLFDVRIYLSS